MSSDPAAVVSGDAATRRVLDGLGFARAPTRRAIRVPRLESYRLSANASGTEDTVDALVIDPIGNFGNHYLQVLHATALAEATGIPAVCHPFAEFAAITAGRPAVRRGSPAAGKVALIGPFLFPEQFAPLQRTEPAALGSVSDRLVRPATTFPIPATGDARIVVNIRGGADLFGSHRPHPGYGQPPHAFHTMAIRHAMAETGATAVRVVHQDGHNPTVMALLVWLRHHGIAHDRVSGGPGADAAAVLAGSHLVLARSSFSSALAVLSRAVERVYVHDRTFLDGVLAARVPTFRIVDAGHPEAGEVWRNTAEQRARLIDLPESALRMERADPADGVPAI